MSDTKKIENKVLKKVQDEYKKIDPKYKEISRDDVEFYLAKPIIWSFRIPKSQLSKMQKLLKIDNIDEYFMKTWYSKPVYDKEGDVTEIPLGSDADIWPFDELPKFSECVDDDSSCVFQDDTGRFWKIIWKNGKISYWMQTSEVDSSASYLEILNALLAEIG